MYILPDAIILNLFIPNEITFDHELINSKVLVIKSPFKVKMACLILKVFSLSDTIPSHFSNFIPNQPASGHDSDKSQEVYHESGSKLGTSGVFCSGCKQTLAAQTSSSEPHTQTEIVDSRNLLDFIEPMEDGIVHRNRPWDLHPLIKDNSSNIQECAQSSEEDSNLPLIITNDAVFKNQIQAICREFQDVFSETLPQSPAHIEPMHLTVDTEKWHSTKSQRAPRRQIPKMEAEMIKQLEAMKDMHLIQPSQARTFSQILLVAKPGGKWRFCVDYRRLNDLTTSLGWPIPNIKDMMTRLGSNRSKYFGILDLSSGYYQAPWLKSRGPSLHS